MTITVVIFLKLCRSDSQTSSLQLSSGRELGEKLLQHLGVGHAVVFLCLGLRIIAILTPDFD